VLQLVSRAFIAEPSAEHGPSSGLRRVLAAGLALVAAACAAGPERPAPVQPAPPVASAPTPDPLVVPVPLTPPAYTPAHMQDLSRITRVALLLPFSASDQAARAEAGMLLRAAELALFERAGADMLLLPKDTRGTERGAADAAQAAIDDGADVILGPLFAAAVRGAAEPARQAGVPVIAFSTNASVAGDGVFLLSFPPEEEVRRVVRYAMEQGADRYAFIGPSTPYGSVAADAYRDAISQSFGELVAEEYYFGGVQAMTEAARRLADLGVEPLDPEVAAEMTGLEWIPPDEETAPFEVVMLPEGGDDLITLAPVLIYADIDPLLIKFIGTGLWNDPATRREPALANGWFAGPDPASRERFADAYEAAYDEAPSRLAGLGYDAAALAALLARQTGGVSEEGLLNPDGFLGVDGLFRFRENGTLERGLAVYTLRRGGFVVLDPAPESFPPRGSDVLDPDVTPGMTGGDAEAPALEPGAETDAR